MDARSLGSAVLLIALTVSIVAGASGTDPIPGPVTAEEAKQLDWPDGSLPLVNDPARVRGYHPWFSQLPNAGRFFDFDVKSMDDVNRLVALLGEVKAAGPVLEISPLAGADGPENKGPSTGAHLSITSQAELDRWFDRLTEEEKKKFRTAERPIAPPPTLTIYAGHAAIDLAKLRVPARVTLASGVTIRDRQDAGKDAGLKQRIAQVEAFLKERRPAQQ